MTRPDDQGVEPEFGSVHVPVTDAFRAAIELLRKARVTEIRSTPAVEGEE